jgi:hypothetical protein
MNNNDLTNQQFGKLTALRVSDERWNTFKVWECICECGNSCLIRSADLVRRTRSCGCIAKENLRKRATKHITKADAAISRFYTSYKSHAWPRNYSFELTIDQFKAIITQSCKYCGSDDSVMIVRIRGNNSTNQVLVRLRVNGVDRYDNTLGYTIENSVPCCSICNIAKMDKTAQQYIDHCRLVTKYNE